MCFSTRHIPYAIIVWDYLPFIDDLVCKNLRGRHIFREGVFIGVNTVCPMTVLITITQLNIGYE